MTIDFHSHPEAAEPVAEEVRALGDKALLIQAEVTDQAAVESLGEPFQDFSTALREMKTPAVLAVLSVAVLAVLVILGLAAAGYFYIQNIHLDFAAAESFKRLMEVHDKIIQAREGSPDPVSWETTSGPLRETLATVQRKMKGVKAGSPRKEVARMATYLRGMLESAAKTPLPDADDEFDRNKKLFEASMKKAMQKLGLSRK